MCDQLNKTWPLTIGPWPKQSNLDIFSYLEIHACCLFKISMLKNGIDFKRDISNFANVWFYWNTIWKMIFKVIDPMCIVSQKREKGGYRSYCCSNLPKTSGSHAKNWLGENCQTVYFFGCCSNLCTLWVSKSTPKSEKNAIFLQL